MKTRAGKTTGFVVITMLLSAGQGLAQTRSEIQMVQTKINGAQKYLAKTWTAMLGPNFVPPRVVTFEGPTKTGCGTVEPGNEFFCEEDNTVYLDLALLAKIAKQASAELKTDGDYAAIVAVAHEYGHAVGYHTTFSVLAAAEGAADCFAGAATRQAKIDRLLEQGDLAEALFTMEFVSDDKQLGFNPKNMGSVILATARYHPDHGTVAERQAAFMRGYYGGPRFCTDGIGTAKPSTPGRVISSMSLVPPSTIPSGSERGCTWSNGPQGLSVRNASANASCTLNLLPDSTFLPDHVRIELTVTHLANRTTGRGSNAGIYYGDARATAKRTRIGFGPHPGFDTLVTNIDGEPAVDDPLLRVFLRSGTANKGGEDQLTLDIHHEGKDVYFIEYLNGIAVNHNAIWHGVQYRRFGFLAEESDQVGLWLPEPGSDAIFKDFRVLALPD